MTKDESADAEREAEIAEHLELLERARGIVLALERDLGCLEEMAKGRAVNLVQKSGQPLTAESVQAVINAASEALPAPNVDPVLRAMLGACSLTARELDGFVQVLNAASESLRTGETMLFLNYAEPRFDGRLIRPLFEGAMRAMRPIMAPGVEVSIVLHRLQDDGALSATFSTTLIDPNVLAKVLSVLGKRLGEGLEPVRAKGVGQA